MNYNRTILAGNMTRNPELKTTQTGNYVCSFTIATNRFWKDRQGQKQTDTQFHNCVAWGKAAETIAQYMTKGSLILVEGRLQTRSWEAKDGSKRHTTEVLVEAVQFGPQREKPRSEDTGEDEAGYEGAMKEDETGEDISSDNISV